MAWALVCDTHVHVYTNILQSKKVTSFLLFFSNKERLGKTTRQAFSRNSVVLLYSPKFKLSDVCKQNII